MSLVNCLKKAGKSINKTDADMLMTKREELIAKGITDADSVALKMLEDEATADIADIYKKAGIEPKKSMPAGAPITIDGKAYDSNQFIAGVDRELEGIDSILGCIYK